MWPISNSSVTWPRLGSDMQAQNNNMSSCVAYYSLEVNMDATEVIIYLPNLQTFIEYSHFSWPSPSFLPGSQFSWFMTNVL